MGTVRTGPELGVEKTVGEVMLVGGADGKITGTIHIEGEYFLIRPLSNGVHVLVEVDESKYPSGGDSPVHDGGSSREAAPSTSTSASEVASPSAASEEAAPEEASPEGTCTASTAFPASEAASDTPRAPSSQAAPCPQSAADVLVVYTSAAANEDPDIDGTIDLAVQESNAAYDNSNATGVELNLAHSQQVGFDEGDDIEEDIGLLVNNSAIQSLRDQHDADVVVLLTDAGYTNDNGDPILGVADEIRAEAEDAYAIVEVAHATAPQYTFVHEVGHLQGAQHNPENACHPDNPNYPACDEEGDLFSDAYGHRFVDDPWWCLWPACKSYYRTVMAYNPPLEDYTRVNRFSNPNVTYSGEPTGTNDRDNAQALRTTANTVKNFRNSAPLQARLQVVSGNPYDPETSDYVFEGNPCGGSGSYSYEWRISYHGPGDYGNVLSTSKTFSKSFPPGTHFVKLTVSSGGQQASEIQSVVFDPYPSTATASAS